MAKKRPPRRLFKTPDRVSSYQHDRSPVSRMKRMAREHEDVLQNIEFALVDGRRDDPGVDDRDALAALIACRLGTEAEEPRVGELVDRLTAIRELREDVSADVWAEALRVIEDSVRRHSNLRPGEISYFDFAARYIP